MVKINEDFESDSWSTTATSYSNITVNSLDTNYPQKGATTSDGGDAYIIWTVTNDEKAIEELEVEFIGRNIMGTTFKLLYSVDNGENWTTFHENDASTSHEAVQTKYISDLDATSVQIKAFLSGGAWQWAFLDDITISVKAEIVVDYDQPDQSYSWASIFSETFEADTWQTTAKSYNNIKVCDLDDNYHQKVATTENGSEAYIIWELGNSGKTMDALKIEFKGRSIMDTSMKLLYSVDNGATWTQFHENDASTAHDAAQIKYISGLDATSVQIKVVLNGGAYQWAMLDDITVFAGTAYVGGNDTTQENSKVVTWNVGSDQTLLTGGSYAHVETSAGDLDADYDVFVLAGGSSVSFTLPAAISTATNLAMELQEIHLREDDDLTYKVLLNDTEVDTRSITPTSEGPAHWWVTFSKEALHTESDNVVTISNTGTQALRLSKLWFYENLNALMVEEDVYQPLEVVLFSPSLTYSNYETDKQKLESIKSQFSGYNMYTIGFAFDIYYMRLEEAVLLRRLDYLIRLCADVDVPVKLDLNSWWSGTPDGMDGQGGYWNDITGQQIIYDPDNVNGRGVWQLTTPNSWSNTPWLSLNNTALNEIRAEKLERLTAYIAAKEAEYQADVTIFLENEPIYWAYQHYNPTSEEGRADLSYLVIQAAAKDGVTLDPTDGLSAEEQLWLFKNLNDYIVNEGEAVSAGAGTTTVSVNGGTTALQTEPLSEKLYSHIYGFSICGSETVDGEFYPFWEWHLTDTLRFGLEEASTSYIEEAAVYAPARGTWADVNIERSAISNVAVLKTVYQYGADYAIIFNYQASDYTQIQKADSELSLIADEVAQRTQNLWIACRADVERLMESYQSLSSSDAYKKAVAAYDNGRYETAYQIMTEEVATQVLPVRFSLSGSNNQLLDYPVTVSVADGYTVSFTLYEVGNTLRFAVEADEAVEVQVTWNETGYHLTNCGDGVYEMTTGNSTGTATVTAKPYYTKDYPDQFSASFRSYSASANTIAITSQDGEISEYASSVSLKLADNCVVTRELDGDTSTRTTVESSELARYDQVDLTLNENDEVTEIRAIYGVVHGSVVSVTLPVVDGNKGLATPKLTLKTDDGEIMEFELCAITSFNYPTKTGGSVNTSDLSDYGLAAGDTLTVKYSPYRLEGTPLEAISLYRGDHWDTVLTEDFEDGELGDVLTSDNVHICDLDSNYHNKVVAALDQSKVGSVVWKIEQEDGYAIGTLQVVYGARSILGTKVTFYISYDNGETWELLHENNCDDFAATQYITVENITQSSVQIKVVLDETNANNNDTWASLDKIKFNMFHAIEHVEAKEATAEEDGNVEYWYCAACDTYYLDENLRQETTAEKVKLSYEQPKPEKPGSLLPLIGVVAGATDKFTFSDVAKTDWFYDAVQAVCADGLMNGTGNGKFSPYANTTRGMIVTILARIEGVDTTGTPWYAAGQKWAMENRISDGTNMTGEITREQLAAMLYRYAKQNGYDVSASASISSYADAADVSNWALEAMQWATAVGLLQGSNNKLTPGAFATRAQVAAVLQRFTELVME